MFLPSRFSYFLPPSSHTIFYLSMFSLLFYVLVFLFFSGVFILVAIGMHISLLSSSFYLIFIIYSIFAMMSILLNSYDFTFFKFCS
jgi:hypothetical protein